MIYTAYSKEQYEELPKKYRNKVLGVSYEDNILQPPLCPECGGEMMPEDGYLSCTVCCITLNKRIIKE